MCALKRLDLPPDHPGYTENGVPQPTAGDSKKAMLSIDINAAGVEEWKALPGIGEVIGNRIIKYRERLGGFLSVAEVKRTYGISDSLFEKISGQLRFSPASLPKFNVNTASLYELRSKLGISFAAAKAIIGNREQRGAYGSLEEIRNVTVLPDSSWQKLVLIGTVN
jgi:competence protein ComEA